ncbi:MAG: diguanylate cyclase [Candidatus Acidiferrum sp.]|jgi:diguanylate cyclase (GGDEF)-like protein/PAS domain S-box-containing protein
MARFDDPEILRSILEELPTGVYLVGRDGRILFWNYGAERITGHLRQDVVGHACREDFLGDMEGNHQQTTAASAALEAVLKDGKAVESQVSFRHKSGHLVPVRLRAIPMKDTKGSTIGVVECLDEMIPMAEWDRRHDKLAEYGCLDAASGLLNHKMIQSRLRECLAIHEEQPVPFCIACIAFDHLAEMKARYGAGAIAAVLRTAGLTLENSLRPTDYLGRWQDNEFLAIMTECNREEVISVGERLSKMITGAKISWWGDSVPLTISMGATEAKAKDTVEEIMRRAEGALRESISSGGNRMTVWND